MSLWDDFKAGVSELVNAPASFVADASSGVTGTQGDYSIGVNTNTLDHSSLSPTAFAGNSQPPATNPTPHNTGFTTGLNLLLSDPSQFLNQLTGGNPADIPTAELNKVATKPVSDNLPTIPTWAKVTAIVGVGILGLFAISLTIHEAKRL